MGDAPGDDEPFLHDTDRSPVAGVLSGAATPAHMGYAAEMSLCHYSGMMADLLQHSHLETAL